MKLLAIETATESCSAALSIDGDSRVRYEFAPRRHAELILSMVDDLLKEADLTLVKLDGLAFGCGPGAFTGVRVATGVIQGLAYSTDLAVAAISSLATLAQSVAAEHNRVIPAFDARMGEIYYGLYEADSEGIMCLQGDEDVAKPEVAKLPAEGQWYGLGSGWHSYASLLSKRMGEQLTGYVGTSYPSAEHIIPLALRKFQNGEIVSAEQALPVYLRNKVTN